ncbi:Homeobox-like domain superfamily [Babesia duncani]|uniref:Homeobox-like domain superfamily n=1 Tax=Babesia duncani TaxID=323732 RepID=A0AAD9PI67_9APIC|nr:Homeobox-like domain superfamily [Babesia duncani]
MALPKPCLRGIIGRLTNDSWKLQLRCNGFKTTTLRLLYTSRVLRDDTSTEDLGPPIKRPLKYLDMKTFRKFLKQQKTFDIEAEKRAIAKAHAKEPPEGIDAIAGSFDSWNHFISSTIEELCANTTITSKQRRIIYKHIWFALIMYDNFQAPPLENEGKVWDEEADAELMKWAEYYDVEFGDPWIYISNKMQRTIEDVQNRFIEIYLIPKYRKDRCELAITKAFKPLLMNRYFKMDPPYLYIIPSKENFPLTDIYKEPPDNSTRGSNKAVEPHQVFSNAFLKYRRPECFANDDSKH